MPTRRASTPRLCTNSVKSNARSGARSKAAETRSKCFRKSACAGTTALERLATNAKIASDQLEYNLLKRGPENEIFPLLAEYRIGLLAHSPLDAGSLAGTPFNVIRSGYRPAFQPANAAIIRKALRDSVAPVARQYDESIATICLAWLLHQEQVYGVVVGASHPDQAIANARAGDVVLRDE